MSIEVGDIVNIHPDLYKKKFVDSLAKPHPGVTSEMKKLAGKKTKVKEKNKNKHFKEETTYRLEVDNKRFKWTSDMFLSSRITLE